MEAGFLRARTPFSNRSIWPARKKGDSGGARKDFVELASRSSRVRSGIQRISEHLSGDPITGDSNRNSGGHC